MGRLSAVVPEVRPADASQQDSDNRVCRCRNGGIGPLTDLDGVRSLKDGGAHGYAPSVDGAAAYSASLTWSPHVALFPLSSVSSIPMCVMKRVEAAPCQWSSPGSKNTRSPGRITSIGPPRRRQRPMPSVTQTVWPLGWVCQAVRAPGVKWTLLALSRDPPDGAATVST